eukprot:scaffold346119_cov24-Attheya_sp.AAC.1
MKCKLTCYAKAIAEVQKQNIMSELRIRVMNENPYENETLDYGWRKRIGSRSLGHQYWYGKTQNGIFAYNTSDCN